MWTEDYRWHFDYVRLAWDTGFSFEKYKYPNLDKNKICLVDIDRIVKERDVASVDRYIPTVVQYILESDQAEVLDTNFVKMFRISQLSVEYLLFCKKYLDNTVVLLKKELTKFKEENKELKLFSEDLENHVSSLTKHNNLVTTFKCGKCPKAFSTEEYLSSHIKRRHNDENKEPGNAETDKLQSEIKQLKERLNVTEKLLQDRDEKIENKNSDFNINENKLKVNEIQEKFERFQEKVENDIRILQVEKNFYEEKYGKLFDVVLHTNNKENINKDLNSVRVDQDKQSIDNISEKMENTTQTDKETRMRAKALKMETVHDKNIYNFKHISSSSESVSEKKVDIQHEIEQKISKFEEDVESKITSSLSNIETQMQAFWGKLTELELKREENITVEEGVQNNFPEQLSETLIQDSKPNIKPRTKFSKPTKVDNNYNQENANRIKAELEKMYSQCQPKTTDVDKVKNVPKKKESKLKIAQVKSNESKLQMAEVQTNMIYEPAFMSQSESETQSSLVEVAPKPSQRSLSTLSKKSTASLKSTAENKEILDKLREEISDIINSRLQEIGISPNWKGIPQKTYDKALEIVNHQANLTKKSYSNFDSIKKSIEKSLKNNKDVKKTKKLSKITTTSPSKQQNVINISYRRKSSNYESNPEPKPSLVTIKNRAFYDTDTESESLRSKPSVKNVEAVPPYSAVIEELKTHTTKIDTESDSNSVILPNDDNKNEPQTKSALRSYPSVGSLTKKKVLFDIEKSQAEYEPRSHFQGAGESTSNAASLVSDNPEVIARSKKEGKNDSSFSDFDLSEL